MASPEYNPKVKAKRSGWRFSEKVSLSIGKEPLNTELSIPPVCIGDTKEDEMELMANSVVDSMTAILFAETHDKAGSPVKHCAFGKRIIAR